MKTNRKTAAGLAAFVIALALAPAFAAEPSQAELRAQAKVSEAQATATALAKVPRGTVKSVELESEKGTLVWSFDVARAGTRGVTEIWVDAMTGKIVSLRKETPTEETAERRAEAKAAK